VSLTCTGAPTGSTCVLTPKIVTPGANATATSSGVVTTTALMIPPRLPNGPRPFLWIWVCTVLSLALALYLARIMAQRPARKLIWAFAFLLFVALAGCSHALRGGGKTLAGSYPLTVKGTSGALNHSATFTLTVQ
ncbi:MAG TPA: hypothetical protein VI431_11510, partial [Candidatus Acidoferrum sp.]